MRVVMHSYTFRNYPLEHAIDKAKAFGYEAIELYVDFFGEDDPALLSSAIDICEDAGLPVATVDASLNFVEGPEAAEKSIGAFAKLVKIAGQRGIPRMNGGLGKLCGSDPGNFSANGSVLMTPGLHQQIVEGMKAADPILESAGVEMTLELHMNMPHDSAASAMSLLEASGTKRISIAHDPGNLYSIGHAENSLACLEAIHPRLTYVHLKNCRKIAGTYSYSVPLPGGDVDYYQYLQRLEQLGYRGDVCIEYCGEGDPHPPAREDLRYLRGILDDLGL